MDVTKLLRKDHDEVRELFKEFENLGEDAERSREEVAARILGALDAHTKVEEQLFYPELETSSEASDLVREAYIEHKQAKTIIASLRGMKVTDNDFDPKMKVLRENIEHHATEEEDELFPIAREVLGVPKLEEIGEEVARLKTRLMGDEPQPAAL